MHLFFSGDPHLRGSITHNKKTNDFGEKRRFYPTGQSRRSLGICNQTFCKKQDRKFRRFGVKVPHRSENVSAKKTCYLIVARASWCTFKTIYSGIHACYTVEVDPFRFRNAPPSLEDLYTPPPEKNKTIFVREQRDGKGGGGALFGPFLWQRLSESLARVTPPSLSRF